MEGRDHGTIATLVRLSSFLGLVGILIIGLDGAITSGLRSLPTTLYGVTNRIMQGHINSEILITGSSRAASHYDPRIIGKITGYSTFNLGRNGSQTDMQLAVLKAYLKHNRRPRIVIHNLDAFTFQTTREVYDLVQYVPYLHEDELRGPLQAIKPEIWKSRYLPLYGYLVEDMSFKWTLGLRALISAPPENLFDGFDPRDSAWTDEFERFKAAKSGGVRWNIETEGVRLMEELIRLCRAQDIRLVLAYSPEYKEMQGLTTNRKEVFDLFRKLSVDAHVPIWDYSNWQYSGDTQYFTNSQHLNAKGATLFSTEIGEALQAFAKSH